MLTERLAFSPSGEFVARREFRFAGRDFPVGADFLWRRMACSPRKLRALYESGYLMYKTEKEPELEELTDDPTTEVIEETTESLEGTPDETVTEEETGDEESDDETDAEEVVEKPKKKKKKKKKVIDE